MLEQIARVMLWLCVGEIAVRSGLLPLAAPVTGLILLYAELAVRGKLLVDLGVLADRVLQFLGMLFVPAGVGVIAYFDLLIALARGDAYSLRDILAGHDGGPFVIAEFVAHDSRLRFRSLNHVSGRAIYPQRLVGVPLML
jgi:hypothetical protein